jgi:riboflavin synthase alpha subunit
MCGECIGVDGACLTVIERGENWFHVEAAVAVLSVKEDGMKRYCEVECPACSTQLRAQIGTPAISQLSLDMTACISYSK